MQVLFWEVNRMQPSINWEVLVNNIQASSNEREIINHFYQTPKACETISDIANNLGKSPDEIERAVRYLEQLGILHNCGAIWGKPSYVGKYIDFYSLEHQKELESVLRSLLKN
jgi:DNA-binding Lrp family transcriptional regulator